MSASVFTMEGEVSIKSSVEYEVMREFFTSEDVVLYGHNIIRYDVPVLEKLLDIKIKARLVDTLALSWYLHNKRPSHGLAAWGEELGVKKPEVDDWEGLDIEEYLLRCESDVRINTLLYRKQRTLLNKLYDDNVQAIEKIENYLSMVLTVHRNIEENPFVLDVEKCEEGLVLLQSASEEKEDALQKAMPVDRKMGKKSRPKVTHKKDGTLSVAGESWYTMLEGNKLPSDYEGGLEYLIRETPANPKSTSQVKKWLFSLGWKPETFSYPKSLTRGAPPRKVPQIRRDKGGEKVLCNSVKKLFDKEPRLELLEGLTVLNHRISILKGFLRDRNPDGTITSSIAGMTNTLRVRHSRIVNLPGVRKPYGELVRGCLKAPEGKLMVGSDLNSLENMVGLHYAKKFDENYVRKILVPGYDAHLFMAEFAKMLTPEDVEFYKTTDDHDSERYKSINNTRSDAKTLNYSATYGVGAPTLSRSINKPTRYAKKLIDAYWKLHKPLKQIAEDQMVKVIDNRMWLYNSMVGFWLELRNEKDIFNTLIQSSGSIITYTWAYLVMNKGLSLSLVYHDELAAFVNKKHPLVKSTIDRSIDQVNRLFELEPKMSVDLQYGKSYADIH